MKIKTQTILSVCDMKPQIDFVFLMHAVQNVNWSRSKYVGKWHVFTTWLQLLIKCKPFKAKFILY